MHGSIDALVNNAGINVPRLLVDPAGQEELTEDVWDKVFAVSVVNFCVLRQLQGHAQTGRGWGVD